MPDTILYYFLLIMYVVGIVISDLNLNFIQDENNHSMSLILQWFVNLTWPVSYPILFLWVLMTGP